MINIQLLIGFVILILSLSASSQIDRSNSWTDAEVDRFYGDAAPERGAAAQHASLDRLRALALNPRQKPPDQVIPRLGEGLRKIPSKNIFQIRDRIEVYDLVQSALLSIPGHARYFADEIKREQKEVENYPTSTGPRISYDRNRAMYFNTLARLPGPETIAVLGEFLSDDIDTPRPLMSRHSDWGENPRANSFGASFTIAAIGLRDAPADKKSYEENPESHLAKTRAWWAEVKSGKRTFSFVGQAVEYRFKPDGTWDTIPIANPPDDAPKPISVSIPANTLPPIPAVQSSAARGNAWQWILIAMIGCLIVVVWAGLRSKKPV